MSFIEYQDLIGKNISVIHQVLGNDFEYDSSNHNLYFKADESYKYFYGMPCSYIIISNKNYVVDSITFYFNEIISKTFYDSFVRDFGRPNTIQVVEKTEILDSGVNDEDQRFAQYLEKRFLTTREGSFEEKPIYMIWKNKKFQIKILQRYSQNITEIVFRVPSENF